MNTNLSLRQISRRAWLVLDDHKPIGMVWKKATQFDYRCATLEPHHTSNNGPGVRRLHYLGKSQSRSYAALMVWCEVVQP